MPRQWGWWTGEDSNLRSPQGAADLQSAGFSHSPTRPAKKFEDSKPESCVSPVAATHTICKDGTFKVHKNAPRARVKRHQPVEFLFEESRRLTPRAHSWQSWRRDLNPRPSDYKSDALPAELRQHGSNRTSIPKTATALQGRMYRNKHAKGQGCGNHKRGFAR